MRILPIILLLLHLKLWAQTAPPAAEPLVSVTEGLSQGMVFSIVQTSDGFLWVATKDGLNRYDGNRFEVYSPDPFNPYSIGNSEVRTLFEDKDHNLWVAYGGGLDVYVPKLGRFFHVDTTTIPHFIGGVNSFAQLPDGSIWIVDDAYFWQIKQPQAALEKAIAKNIPFLQAASSFIHISAIKPMLPTISFINCLYNKAMGLVVATSQGFYSVNEVNMTLTPVPELPDKASYIITGQDANGGLWVQALYNANHLFPVNKIVQAKEKPAICEIWILSGKNASPRHYTMPFVVSSTFDAQGNLWQLKDHTLSVWQPEKYLTGAPPANQFVCKESYTNIEGLYYPAITIDRSGVVWLGTSGFGLLKGISPKLKFNRVQINIGLRKIYEDPSGNVFIGAAPQWLFSSLQFAKPLPNMWMEKMKQPDAFYGFNLFDKQGNLWLNTHNYPDPDLSINTQTLYRIAAKTATLTQFSWVGAGLVELSNGNLLSVTSKGLHKLNPQNGQITHFPFPQPVKFTIPSGYLPNSLFLTADNHVWITDVTGFIHAEPTASGYQFTNYQNDPTNRLSLSNNTVLCIAQDPLEPNRYLWIGTKGGGLNRFDRQNGTFKHYKREQGLPDNVVYGILPDNQGHIWLSTNNGLCRFHVRSETTQNFTTADGLPGNEFNQACYLKTRSGHLVFGGVNGLAWFHPDSLQFNLHSPKTAITRLYVNNQLAQIVMPEQPKSLNYNESTFALLTDIAFTNRIVLPHHQNLLTFEFAALDFHNPSQNLYQYQLAGIDPNWVGLGNKNTVQFSNLKPGNYTLNVLGSNNDGVWAEQPATLQITILPPWWQTYWAYFMYLFFAGAAMFTAYRYQLKRQLEQQETRRLKELDDFKNRLFTNITHEFRTPLTVILGMAERLHADRQLADIHDQKNAAALIKRNGQNLLRLINQILDLAKLESNSLKLHYIQGNVMPYLRYIAESLQSLAETKNVLLNVEAAKAEIITDYDPEHLLQIVYNLLSNAIKFTPSGGQVLMRIEQIASQLNDNKLLVKAEQVLLITVADEGLGIPPDELAHIFDRFYQASNQDKSNTGGTGIGLALTQELVKAMGGAITVSSTINQGTTFTVALPITQHAPITRFDADSLLAKETVASPHFYMPDLSNNNDDKPVLLLIEDNPDVMQYLAACFTHETNLNGEPAYQLQFAYNGADGIDKALHIIPDLIISDVMMPQKDGFEVCQTLKNDNRTSHIPIVLLTAKADVANRIAGLKTGADAYLAKPFNREELLITLANLLALRKKLQAKYSAAILAPPLTEPNQHHHETPAPPESDSEDLFLQKIRAIVEQNMAETDLDMQRLERDMAMSRSQIFRKIKALTGKAPTQFIRSIRLHHGRHLLLTTNLTVTEIAYEVGFSSVKYFSDAFTEEFGERPTQVRR